MRTVGRLARTLAAVYLLCGAVAAGGAAGEVGELVTDRPDQTESSSTVPAGFVQLEAGWLREELADDRRSESLPGTLVRIGLADEWELRVGWSGWIEEESGPGGPPGNGGSIDGTGDAELGLKWHLWAAAGNRPDAALLVGASVPIGSAAVTSDAWDPAFRLAFEHECSPAVGLAYNLGYAWETSEDEDGERSREGAAVWTAALGFALNEEVGAFIELFGTASRAADESSVDGGFTWRVRPNLQIDLYAGVGLTSTAADSFVGLGLSWRLPH